MGSIAKSYMKMSFLIYEEMRKYLTIYEEEEAVGQTWICNRPLLNFLMYLRKIWSCFYQRREYPISPPLPNSAKFTRSLQSNYSPTVAWTSYLALHIIIDDAYTVFYIHYIVKHENQNMRLYTDTVLYIKYMNNSTAVIAISQESYDFEQILL